MGSEYAQKVHTGSLLEQKEYNLQLLLDNCKNFHLGDNTQAFNHNSFVYTIDPLSHLNNIHVKS